MKSDLNKMSEWFYTYIVEQPPQSSGGGYVEDVTWDNESDEDKPRGEILKGFKEQSSCDEICSQTGMTGMDIKRFHLAFKKLKDMIFDNRFKNQYRLRMSAPFKKRIITLMELELVMMTIKDYDPVYGDTIPNTELSMYLE